MSQSTRAASAEDVGKYIDEVWKNVKCECCGKSDWGLAGEPPDITYTLAFHKNGDISNTTDLRVHYSHIFICVTCGNMKFIYKPYVESWINSRSGMAEQ